jgi:hypothetical protein
VIRMVASPARTLYKYNRQIEHLSKELGCKVHQGYNMPGMMYVEFGYIEVPTIHDQKDYLVNLHELGHFALGHTQGRPPAREQRYYFDNGVLKSEAQAWEWAMDRSITRLTDNTRRFIWDTCLGSYYEYGFIGMKGRPSTLRNGNRNYVTFIYDKPTTYFAKIVRRMQDGLSEFKIRYPQRRRR